MVITAATVKELRERTGSGMMDCKKALQEADGDIEKAIEDMRKSGMAKAAKKAGRVAAEGLVVIKQNSESSQVVIAEINSETDFVAKDESFISFCDQVVSCILADQPADIDALMGCTVAESGQTVEETRQQLVAKIGENTSIRRFSQLDSTASVIGAYLHGVRIGVIVELEGGDEALAKDIAMHIAASNPVCIAEEDVPKELLDKEREILIAQAQESGKPQEIIEKMIDGRINKFLQEITLLGQPFVKDPDQTIAKLLESAGATIKTFIRYEVGEGIEKKSDNFAEEVMAQAKGA
ncbi:MAG: elongation factor Ts [Gammaproteobacteria bacterium]|jgi:elongation factor Ts